MLRFGYVQSILASTLILLFHASVIRGGDLQATSAALNPDGDLLVLRERLANSTDGVVVLPRQGIIFASGTAALRISASNIILKGSDSPDGGVGPWVTVDCGGADTAFDISGDNVTIVGVEVRNCRGPAVRHWNRADGSNQTTLTLQGCAFNNNTGPENNTAIGGALQLLSASNVSIVSCRFENNSALRGGGIGTNSSSIITISIDDSLFLGNVAVDGGAVFAQQQTVLLLRSSRLQGNQATTGVGGAVFADVGVTVDIYGCQFESNVASYGGALGCHGCAARLGLATFTSNQAASGGVLFLDQNATVDVIMDSQFKANHATTGAVVLAFYSNITKMSNVTLEENFMEGDSTLPSSLISFSWSCLSTIQNSTMRRNVGNIVFMYQPTCQFFFEDSNVDHNEGPAMFSFSLFTFYFSPTFYHPVVLRNSEFVGNKDNGVVMFAGVQDANLTKVMPMLIFSCIFKDNMVKGHWNSSERAGYGGAIRVERGWQSIGGLPNFSPNIGLIVFASTFINNSAEAAGGAIAISNRGYDVILGSQFLNNTAGYYGGAIFYYDVTVVTPLTLAAYTYHPSLKVLPLSPMYTGIYKTTYFPLEGFQNIYASTTLSFDWWFANRYPWSWWDQTPPLPASIVSWQYNKTTIMIPPWPVQYDALYSSCEGTVFLGNTALLGGAMAIMVLYSPDSSTNSISMEVDITSAWFGQNMAGYGGGLYTYGSPIYVVNCTFVSNVGMYGAGILFDKRSIVADFRANMFINHTFNLPSPGLQSFYRRVILVSRDLLVSDPASVATGLSGGTVVFLDCSCKYIYHCSFTSNTGAEQGAALYMSLLVSTTVGDAFMLNTTFVDNLAMKHGGAIWIGVPRTQLTLQDVRFINNTASMGRGGAVYIEQMAPPSWLLLSNALFIGNTALLDGGAAAIVDSSSQFAAFFDSSFTSNYAGSQGGGFFVDKLASLLVKNVTFIKNVANVGGGLATTNLQDFAITGSLFDTNMAIDTPSDVACTYGMGTTAGGAAAIYQRNMDMAIFEGCVLQGNSANNGGGLFVYAADLCDSPNVTCGATIVHDTAFWTNTALNGGGGAIYSYNADTVSVACDGTSSLVDYSVPHNFFDQHQYVLDVVAQFGKNAMEWLSTNKVTLPQPCAIWRDNTALYGSDLAAKASLFLPASNNVSGLVIASNQPLQLQVELQDAFENHIIAVGPVCGMRELIEISSSPLDALSGQRVAEYANGSARFEELKIRSKPGTVNLSVATSFGSQTLSYTVRECVIGEVRVGEELCKSCGNGAEFSFNPANTSCDRCPTNAQCEINKVSNGAICIPDNGFWHSAPFSPQMHKCPQRHGCTYSNRTNLLGQVALDHTDKSNNMSLASYWQLQCNRGYTGATCGACADGYGHGGLTRCIKCQSHGINALLYVLFSLVTVLVIASIVACQVGPLNAHWMKHTSVDENIGNGMHGRAAAMNYAPHRDSSQSPSSITSGTSEVDDNYVMKPDSNMQVISMNPSDGNAMTDQLDAFHAFQQKSTTSALMARAYSNTLLLRRMSVVGKILVSYLQVIALVLQVNIDWPASTYYFLSIIGHVVNKFGTLVTIECSLSGQKVSKAVQEKIIGFLQPAIIAILAIPAWALIYICFIGFAMGKLDDIWTYLRPRLIITFITITFFLYPSVTYVLLSIFDCKQIDSQHHGVAYYDKAKAALQLWTGDYDSPCWKGQHIVLALALGVPGVALFSCGIPIVMWWFLRAHTVDLSYEGFACLYGALYHDYRLQYCYWESIIKLRKLAVVTVVVFLGSTNGTTQLYAVVGVLLVAYALQTVFRPFNSRAGMHNGNKLEELGLRATILTVFLCLSSTDGGWSNNARLGLSALLIILNASVILYFLYILLKDLVTYVVQRRERDNSEALKHGEMMDRYAMALPVGAKLG